MKNSNSENDFKRSADNFNPVKEYKDSATLIEKCYEKAEIARKDVILVEAKRKMENSFIISHCEAALKLLETIPGHRDADEELAVCKKKIEDLKAKEEAERLEKEITLDKSGVYICF